MTESESKASENINMLVFDFQWNGKELDVGRTLFYGKECLNMNYAKGMGPVQNGIVVVSLSPLPIRFLELMQAKSIGIVSSPPLTLEAGTLRISVRWSDSHQDFQAWLNEGVHPLRRGGDHKLDFEEERKDWIERLGGTVPKETPIHVRKVNRRFIGKDAILDSTLLGEIVLTENNSAVIEVKLNPLTEGLEFINIEFPKFIVEFERQWTNSKLNWLNRQETDSSDTETEMRAKRESASLSPKQSKKKPFWKFW